MSDPLAVSTPGAEERGSAGLYGKCPAIADFVWRGLPRSFVDPWVRFLTPLLDQGGRVFGADWPQVFLTGPLWRFVLTPRLCGGGAWAGVLAGSLDRVGRHFPLTLACPLPADVDMARLTRRWAGFTALETLALGLLDQTLTLEEVLPPLAHLPTSMPMGMPDARLMAPSGEVAGWWLAGPADELTAEAVEAGLLQAVVAGAMPRASLWWQHGWNDLPAASLFFAGLPPPSAASALFAVR